MGMEKAESMTAKKFKISRDDVVNVKVEGGKAGWLLPGEEREQTIPKSEEERKKENQEFAVELYKAAEQIRKRGY